MVKILIAVSGIGLGHVARARVLAKALASMGANVELLGPPPIGSYLRSYSMEPHPVSDMLEPYSPIVDRFYSSTRSGRIGLKMELEEAKVARKNAEIIEGHIKLDSYDVVVSDESWELMYMGLDRVSSPKVLVTDFISYPYRRGLIAAIAFNRFMSSRLSQFDILAFTGFPQKICAARWPPLVGRRLSEAIYRVEVIGLIPPALEDEILTPKQALDELGLDEPPILALPGGTKAGHDIIHRAAASLARDGFKVVTTLPDPPSGAYRVPGEKQYRIPLMMRGFSSAVTLGGLSSLASVASLGIPALAIPLPGHFEQAENVILASRHYRWIRAIPASKAVYASSLLKDVKKPSGGDSSIFTSPYKLARLILHLARGY